MYALWNFRSPQQLSAGFLLWSQARRKTLPEVWLSPLSLFYYPLLDSLSWWKPIYSTGESQADRYTIKKTADTWRDRTQNVQPWIWSQGTKVLSFLSWWFNGNGLGRLSDLRRQEVQLLLLRPWKFHQDGLKEKKQQTKMSFSISNSSYDLKGKNSS